MNNKPNIMKKSKYQQYFHCLHTSSSCMGSQRNKNLKKCEKGMTAKFPDIEKHFHT